MEEYWKPIMTSKTKEWKSFVNQTSQCGIDVFHVRSQFPSLKSHLIPDCVVSIISTHISLTRLSHHMNQILQRLFKILIFNKYLLQKSKFGEFVEQTQLVSILTGVSCLNEILSESGMDTLGQIVKCSSRFLSGKLLESQIQRDKP